MPDAPTIEIVNSFDWDDWEGEDITTEITIDNTSYKDGDIIYYTTDGSDPTTSSTVKTGVNTYKLLYYDVMNAGYNYNSVDAIRAVVNRGDVTTTETRVDKIDDPTFTESGNSLTISNSNADWIVYKQNNTDWTRIEGNSVTINNPDYPVSAIAVKNGYLMSNIAMYVGGDKYDDWIPSWTTGEPNYNNLNKDNDLPEKSVVKSPSLELWAGNPSSFDGKHISHKAISVPNGIYRITLDFTAMNQSNVPDNIGGCGFYERNIDNNTNVNIGVSNVGTQFTYSSKPQWSANTLNGYARTGTVDMIVEITDGEINFEIDFAGCKFNWFVFKNFNYEYLGSQDNMFVHYEGVASQMGIPPAGLKTDYKTSADDPRIASGVTIQRAHEYTHDIYVMPGEKVNLQPFSDFSNKYEYRNAYQRWYDYTTDSKSSRLTFYQEPNSLKSENYYCSNLFNFNNTNNNSIPNGFHLRGNGTDANGGTNVSNSVSSKQKFADGGTLVHVISLHANSSSDKVSMTFGENGQLHLKPGKFRISFDCVGVGGGYPTVEFSIAPRNNTSATIFKGNVSPYPYTVNSFSNTVEDSKYFNTTITIENEADYVLIWQMDGMDTGTQTFAFDNIQVAGIGEMTNTNLDSNVREFYGADGVSKGHFGGTALNTGRTVATIATYTAPTSTDDIFDIIAIDIANDNSSTKYNTDLVLEEPTLSYRHIFVIHNAQVQAEEISGSKSNNDNYIRTHRIKISCPEGTPLQYRLDNYEYRGWGANAKPSGYYIKTGTDTYAPVYHYRVEFLEGENQGYNNIQYNEIVGCTVGNLSYDQNGEIIGHNLNKQFAEHPILSQEETVCNNMQRDLVYTYKCTDGFDRMLYWKEPVVGNYRIRIYAVSAPNAESYSDIDIWDYDGQNIVLMEYDLEVLPASKASMVDENTLKNNSTYSHQSSQALQEAYGDPTVKVDFDEITLDQCNLGNNNHGYYKWPLTWEMSSYAFCYDNANNTDVADYNTYMVANKASQTAYHSSSANDVYDRRYADTNGSQLGFFFYANAASDPGRMAVLNIGNNLCQGTRIFVSAWVNELNNWPETANVCFAFKGVMADGTEDLLGSYVSGYVTGGCNDVDGFHSSAVEGGHSHGTDNRTKWMHIYFCVTPSSNYGNKNYDHYIIALENNSASSFGADYAIDDIQTFVCHPELQAFQEKPVCNGDPATKLILRTDYDLLLQAFPTQYIEQSEHSDVSMAPLYFTFIDKDKYESLLEPDGSNYDEAFDASIVRGAYPNPSNMKGPANPERTYGKMWFDLYYNGNPSHQTSGAEILNTTTTRELIGERRLLYFPSVNCINDVNIKIGTNYWCVMSAYDPGLDETPLSQTFDLRDVCTSKREFEVIFSGEIKVDGKLTAKDATQNICANQRPKIEINLNGISKGGDVVKTENAYFDWYFGPMNDPDPSTIGADDEDRYYYNEKYAGQDLYTALAAFRDNYPEDDDVASCEVKGTFIQAMKDCIEHFVEEGILSLYKTTEFASTYDKFNEPLSSNEQKEIELTAIPINPTPDDETILYCLEAFQINIPISTRTPILKNGDDKGIVPYPSHMRDVPLRIGLKELQRCCTLSSLNDDSGYKFLYMPLRDPTPVTEGVDKMAITKSKDDAVYLVASNDPNVAAGTSGARRVTTYADGTAMDEDEKIYYIGKVSDIVAKTWDKTQSSSNPGNVCHLAFFNNFKFREGYWYTIKFNFEEDYDTTTDDNYDVCPGDVICTIKVVPEYQMWTGKVDGNWNNDANWRRVTKEELMNPTSISADYITDGTGDYANDNTSSFVPADFTKVVIPANSKHMPELYDLRSSGNLEDVDYIGGSGTTNFIRYMTADEEAREGETNNNVQDYRAYIGAASDTINFDMASVVLNDGNVACRSWYDHTCDEIHFMSGAQLINQQYLHYNKAWADIEINPGRWYTMSLPITNVVSGDFYLPTAGARQETPLFEDITYSTELNDRFKPAVYQRTWNASDAKVYKLNAGVENAAEGISLNWSHVYNDALVNYSAGNGYSIKADVSALAETDRPEKVLFRFPKADTSYTYYNPGNTDGDAKTDNVPSTYLDGSSKRTYRLADITSGSYWQSVGENTKNDSKYFLVGNPLMCSLDMEKFFDNNTSLARKYWIVTAEGQRAFVMDEETNGFIGTGTDGKLTQPTVEPFQSFFVALADGSTPGSLRTEIKPEMMVLPENPSDNDPTNNDPTNPSGGDNTRAESNPSGIIHISATDERGLESNMVITDGAIRHTMGAETLFDSNLADEPMLYSVIDGQAMTIGEMKSGQTIPVGITGISGEATITLSGIESFKSSLYLIDALTGETEPLTSDITLKQTGNGVRYYLTSKQAIEEEKIISAPVVLTNRCHLTIKTPADTNIEKIQIFTTGGICVVDEANLGMQYDTDLAADIYIIRLISAEQEYKYKIVMH
ncbi:MAG: chitobiase/beta-hexosaminidase C-terminal domain-containing protein [Prevotellaceae bacterium]|nr:chitobiase/beta-hexosaminidase C-terminal domain-containing protein [Prevotellaceae bacterium]